MLQGGLAFKGVYGLVRGKYAGDLVVVCLFLDVVVFFFLAFFSRLGSFVGGFIGGLLIFAYCSACVFGAAGATVLKFVFAGLPKVYSALVNI